MIANPIFDIQAKLVFNIWALAEFDFRYSNRSALGIEDHQRARKALEGATGKRLKYQGSNQKVV